MGFLLFLIIYKNNIIYPWIKSCYHWRCLTGLVSDTSGTLFIKKEKSKKDLIDELRLFQALTIYVQKTEGNDSHAENGRSNGSDV